MDDLSWYATVISEQSVLGVWIGSTADAVTEALGADFVEDVRRSDARRDYGLIEMNLSRSGKDEPFRCVGITLQTHRLQHVSDQQQAVVSVDHPRLIPPVLAKKVPVFAPVFTYGALERHLHSRNIAAEEVQVVEDADWSLFRIKGSRVVITVQRQDGPGGEPLALDRCPVWSIAGYIGAERLTLVQ